VQLPVDEMLFSAPRNLIKSFHLDLAAAGIEKEDERGRTVDLHALHHTFGTHLSKNGVAPRTARGSIQVSAWRENRRLYLRVQDDGPGLPEGWDLTANEGVGIANTRERLRRLYGESEHSFRIASEPGAGVRVELSFPFREADEVDSQ